MTTEYCIICKKELSTKLADIGYCSECVKAADKALEVIEGDKWKLSKTREIFVKKGLLD